MFSIIITPPPKKSARLEISRFYDTALNFSFKRGVLCSNELVDESVIALVRI